jgi:xylan 1,4-beta-xylosidase
MFARMRGMKVSAKSSGQVELERIGRKGVRGELDVGVLASVDVDQVAALVWHYHDDDIVGLAVSVELEFGGLSWSGRGEFTHFRVDKKHMGSPQQPTAEQYVELTEASELVMLESPMSLEVKNRKVAGAFNLPRQSVSLLLLHRSA